MERVIILLNEEETTEKFTEKSVAVPDFPTQFYVITQLELLGYERSSEIITNGDHRFIIVNKEKGNFYSSSTDQGRKSYKVKDIEFLRRIK